MDRRAAEDYRFQRALLAGIGFGLAGMMLDPLMSKSVRYAGVVGMIVAMVIAYCLPIPRPPEPRP